MLIYVSLGVIAIVIAGMIYFRAAAVPSEFTKPEPNTIGLHKFKGGAKIVFETDDVPTAMSAIKSRITATPRTVEVANGVYLTRSVFWGFPDVAQIWSVGNEIHIHSHLVYGHSDLGVNRQKILDWIEGLY